MIVKLYNLAVGMPLWNFLKPLLNKEEGFDI